MDVELIAKYFFWFCAFAFCIFGFGILLGWWPRHRRSKFGDFASLYGDDIEPGGDPQNHKWGPQTNAYAGPFEFAPDSMEKQVEAVLAATPIKSRRPIFHCEPINIGLGYDQWGNNPYLLHPDDKAYLDRVGVSRAGGDVVCEHCGYTYYMHPPVQGALWATRVCDRENMGRLVKL